MTGFRRYSERAREELMQYCIIVLQFLLIAICIISALVLVWGQFKLNMLELECPDMARFEVTGRKSVRQMVMDSIPYQPITQAEYEVIRAELGLDDQLDWSEEFVEVQLGISEVKGLKDAKISNTKSISAKSDRELLAQAMWAEEGVFIRQYDEKPEEVERVFKLCGSVIMHRAEVGYLGCHTIKDTIFYEGQYASADVIRKGQKVPDIVYQWADELLSEGALGPRGLIFQAQFEQGDYPYDQIGNQIFCVSEKYN